MSVRVTYRILGKSFHEIDHAGSTWVDEITSGFGVSELPLVFDASHVQRLVAAREWSKWKGAYGALISAINMHGAVLLEAQW